ncbi:hypothetical protein, partial [Staphylococcus epidermidis]|uniref:hypothetical protein n=1 Tax=Staphylococcus epidermidis TaxID=1282 RepID=UPI0027390CED
VSLADYKPRDLFAGKDLRLIKAAMPLILKQGYKADEIKIDISEDESKYTVRAVDRKAENSPEQRGSLPGFLIYSVDLDKKELKALRSYYNRLPTIPSKGTKPGRRNPGLLISMRNSLLD